jgi:hypothetical protein
MDVGALSLGERAYLVGLYFADGYMRKHRKTSFEIKFSLQGNEMEIAERVGGMLRRSGLNPWISRDKGVYGIRVTATGTNLIVLFPVKEKVGSMSDASLRWVTDEGAEMPFVAGLLDGDGNTRAYYISRESIFGYVCNEWSFAQVKFPFLVDFFGAYVNSLAAGGASVSVSVGVWIVWVLGSGREALLRRGIAEWSYKVKDWLSRSEKLERWLTDIRSRFLMTGQVARRLGVGKWWIAKLCRLGRIKHILIHSLLAKGDRYYNIIPVEEVERLMGDREKKKKGGVG